MLRKGWLGHRRKDSRLLLEGQRLLLYGGLALLAWPLYELYIRIDAMAGPLKMFFRMAVREHIPVNRVVQHIDWSIFRAPLFLVCCIALGIVTIAKRKKADAALWLLIASVALGAYGYVREGFFVLRTVRALEAVPFAVVILGCVLIMIAPGTAHYVATARRRKGARP